MKQNEHNDLMQRIKLAKSGHIPHNTLTRLNIIIPGTPIPKQSVRHGKFGTYQPPELVYAKKKIKADIEVQLPKGFVPWTGPVRILRLAFVYEFLKSHKKADKEHFEKTGNPLFKITRPDSVDNLRKLPFDCLSGLVYEDDSQICHECGASKYFGKESFTLIELETFEI